MKIKRMKENAIIPTRGSTYAAGYDVYACIDRPENINPGETKKIGTGIAIQPDPGMCVLLFARSGLATKRGLRPANCVGLIDEDYRGEYIVAMHNDSNQVQTINPGDRIGQIVFTKYEVAEFEEVDCLDDSERGSGGFGHTGTK